MDEIEFYYQVNGKRRVFADVREAEKRVKQYAKDTKRTTELFARWVGDERNTVHIADVRHDGWVHLTWIGSRYL